MLNFEFDDLEPTEDHRTDHPQVKMHCDNKVEAHRIRNALCSYAKRRGWRVRTEFRRPINSDTGKPMEGGKLCIWRIE